MSKYVWCKSSFTTGLSLYRRTFNVPVSKLTRKSYLKYCSYLRYICLLHRLIISSSISISSLADLFASLLLFRRLEEDGVISECDIGVLALVEPTSDFQFKRAPLVAKIVVKVRTIILNPMQYQVYTHPLHPELLLCNSSYADCYWGMLCVCLVSSQTI